MMKVNLKQKQEMEAGNKQSTQTNKSEKSEDIVEGRIKNKWKRNMEKERKRERETV